MSVSEVSAIGKVTTRIFLKARAELCGSGAVRSIASVMPSPFNLAYTRT